MFNQVVLHYKLKHSSNRFSRLVYARNIFKKLTVLIGLLVIVITALRLVSRRSSTYSIKEPLFVFESSCECRKWEKIVIEDNLENGYSVFSIDSREYVYPKRLLYNLNRNELEKSNFTCDLFSEFRRGKDQKVISYNLYGDNTRYYEKIWSIVKQAKELYPDWYIRIYSNGSLNESFRCMLECSPESNVEVCNVKQLIPDLNHIKKNQIWDATYIMPSMWRYLPMGDSFVNIMISRDSDSYIIQREKDAVDAWLESGLLGHIMRDSLHHKDVMLAGMWGLRMDIDTHKKLVNKWWNKLIDPNHARGYNPHPSNPKESDQIWLKHIVWWHFSRFALIHDSYNCDKLMGGSPWPTRRLGDCFVGAMHGCNETAIAAREFECPHICRPAQHRDWNTC